MGLQEGLSSKKRDLFRDAVSKRFKKWKNDRTAKEEVWDECFNAFISEFDSTVEIEEFRSKRFIPLSFEAVMNVQSQMAKGLFPSTDFFTASGDNPNATKNEKLRTLYMQNRMEASNFVEEFISSHLWQLIVFGNAPYMLSWDNRPSRSRQTFRDDQGESQLGYQANGETFSISPYVYDGPRFQSLDLYNFVRSPFADDTTQGEIKIYRSLISKAELLAQSEEEVAGYSVYDKKAVKKALDESEDHPKESSDSSAEARREALGISGTDKHDEDTVEILIAHGDFSIENELYQDYIIAVVNRKHLVRCEQSPYKFGLSPLKMSTLIPVKGHPYGLGILESALGLQEVVNIKENNSIDVGNMALNPPILYKDDGVIDVDELIFKPLALWETDDIANIQVMHIPQQAFAGYQNANIHKEEFKDATMSHASFGTQTGAKTATEVATGAGMMQTNLGRLIQRVENKDIEDILLWYDEAEKQFYDPNSEVFARYTDGNDKQFQPITPQVIYESYTWKAIGSGFTHLREMRIQQLQQLLISAAQTPAGKGIDFLEGFKAVATDMGRRDIEKIMPGYQEMMRRALDTGEIPPQLFDEAINIAQQIAKQRSQGGGQGGQAQADAGRDGQIAPGSRNPPGMAPTRGGPIANMGGIPGAAAGGLTQLE